MVYGYERTAWFMNKKALLAAAIIFAGCLSACGNSSDSGESVPIYNVKDVNYDTINADYGTIQEAYYVEGNLRYPYSQYVVSEQNGVINKLFNGMNIEKGQLICELTIDGIDDRLEEQKVIADAAEETYKQLKKSGTKTEIEYAEITYELEKNKYDKLVEEKAAACIYAPCSGTIKIDTDNCYTGAYLSDGQYLCSITDESKSSLCAFVYGDKLDNVNFGSSVTAKQGELINTSGTVSDIIFVDGGPDYSGYMYVIDVPDDITFVDYGTIDVVFNVYEKDNVIVVRNDAIKTVGDRTYVNVLIDGAKIETDVECGIVGDKNTEIINGLSGGELLIIS